MALMTGSMETFAFLAHHHPVANATAKATANTKRAGVKINGPILSEIILVSQGASKDEGDYALFCNSTHQAAAHKMSVTRKKQDFLGILYE